MENLLCVLNVPGTIVACWEGMQEQIAFDKQLLNWKLLNLLKDLRRKRSYLYSATTSRSTRSILFGFRSNCSSIGCRSKTKEINKIGICGHLNNHGYADSKSKRGYIYSPAETINPIWLEFHSPPGIVSPCRPQLLENQPSLPGLTEPVARDGDITMQVVR